METAFSPESTVGSSEAEFGSPLETRGAYRRWGFANSYWPTLGGDEQASVLQIIFLRAI